MYTIEFYETADGKSELWDFLETLRTKAVSSKDARIQYKQATLYIQLLQDNGTRLNENNTFVLLHQFRKKSQKTPKREIERAKAERADYIARKETHKL
mgnify:CR=1 FL=1